MTQLSINSLISISIVKLDLEVQTIYIIKSTYYI